MKKRVSGLFGLLASVLLTSFDQPRVVLMGDMLVERKSNFIEGASLDQVLLWEDGVLPLNFDPSITQDQKDMLLSACAQWSQVANVKCIEGEYKGRTEQVTSLPGGCWSLWGMGTFFVVMNRQINLADRCWRKPTLLHELGHAFGLIHEHQRPDRDDYVTINAENIDSGFLGMQEKVNFDKQESTLKTPYDFTSIMHYPHDAFSSNGQDTIVPKPGYEQFYNVMGRATGLSENDAKIMATLYPLVR